MHKQVNDPRFKIDIRNSRALHEAVSLRFVSLRFVSPQSKNSRKNNHIDPGPLRALGMAPYLHELGVDVGFTLVELGALLELRLRNVRFVLRRLDFDAKCLERRHRGVLLESRQNAIKTI